MYADNSGADVELMNSSIRNTANNPILVELHDGAMDIHDNVIDGGFSIFFMTYGGKDVTKPQRVADNAIRSSGSAVSFNSALTTTTDGRFSDVEISGNTIETGTPATGVGSGISLTNSRATADGAGGLISGVKITDNRLAWVSRPPNPVVSGSRGISLTGRVEGTEISGNSAVGYETGLRAVQTGPHGRAARRRRSTVRGPDHSREQRDRQCHRRGAQLVGLQRGPRQRGLRQRGRLAAPSTPTRGCVLSASAAPTSIQTGGQTSTITAHLRAGLRRRRRPRGTRSRIRRRSASPRASGSWDRARTRPMRPHRRSWRSGADDGTATVSASRDARRSRCR